MTPYNVSHWTISDGKCGLLLFAQSLEELLAPHSHDSHKVSALDFHYLCVETLSVLELIEDDVLEKGNLIPLFSEMKNLFHQDLIAQEILGTDFDSIFIKKNNRGEYDKKPLKIDSGKDVDGVLPLLKKGIKLIIAELRRKNQYYQKLTQEIKVRIVDSGDDLLKLDALWDLTKILASELINRGFNQTYIYDCVIQVFFNPSIPISSVDVLDNFFKCFSPKPHKYSVYLPLNSVKQKRALEDYGPFEIAENTYELFDSAVPYILKYECESIDPYGAQEQALELINFCLSVNQFIKHNKYEYNPKYTEVFDKESHKVTFIRKPEAPIARGYTNVENLDVRELLDTCLNIDVGGFQVLQLHSAALTSKNTDNQLINLWTAIEVAVPVVRKDGLSRINQISNVLTAALGRDYFSTLIHQLFLDIKAVDADLSETIQKVDSEGPEDLKLLSVLLLQKYTDTYDEISKILIYSAPLLACRMHRYRVRWSNTDGIKKFYQAHSERLSQQIMRIYRTRNMLVHDGSSLPYADYVLQNLHYYVDSFIRFLCSYYKLGYRSVPTIADAVQFQEQLYLQSLSQNVAVDEAGIIKYILRE